MSQRQRKRTVNELFHNRFYNPKFIWWSAEDRDWDNMAPVGREFGSPDFERLMQEDYERMRVTLARLVSICSKATATVPEATEFRQEAINVQVALRDLGHDVNLDTAARVWMYYSNSLLAGWMHGAQTFESSRMAITGYCTLGSLEAPGPTGWKLLIEEGRL